MDLLTGESQHAPAILALADGSVFLGQSIGATGSAVGEVVFNTAMTGYQEIITDPSYAEQLVTLTCPHIGNTGINDEDMESSCIQANGLIIRDYSPVTSNWRATRSLSEYLIEQKVVAICGVDTRRLTRHLREHGAQAGCIASDHLDPRELIEKAKAFAGIVGSDLAAEVSSPKAYQWQQPLYQFNANNPSKAQPEWHVVVLDFGVKRNILRHLVQRGCRVTVVPARTAVAEVLALQPDGVVFSNGPGDPAACDYAIHSAQALLQTNVPLLGICLGFQIIGIALGARVIKMKFGHHGANHPVQDCETGAVMITSQNHGFALDADSMPNECRMTHVSLFDRTVQGFAHQSKPVFAFQGHPEAGPGPTDAANLFQRFIASMHHHQK